MQRVWYPNFKVHPCRAVCALLVVIEVDLWYICIDWIYLLETRSQIKMLLSIVSILALALCSAVVNAQCMIKLMFVFCDMSSWCENNSIFLLQPARCSTPERIPGQCVSVYSCPNVLSLFQGQVTPSVAEYLRSLQCVSNVGEYPHVCCIFPSALTPRPPATPKNRFSSGTGNILPTTCQVTTTEDILGDRVVGGVDARLEDYPWTVLLEYQTR